MVLGMHFLSPPMANAEWQRKTEEQIVVYGACMTFFAVMYTVAKWLYPWLRMDREFREFHLATKAHLALLNVGSIGYLVFAIGAQIWVGWFVGPALVVALMLLPIALWELYTTWREERMYWQRRNTFNRR
jgi:hypothetical protein